MLCCSKLKSTITLQLETFKHLIMKRIYLLLFIISIFLYSCNDDDMEIKTNIPISLPINVNEASATNQDTGQPEYSFTASETYRLSDNEDVSEYLDDMKYIAYKGHSVGVNGLADGDTVRNIEVLVGDESVLTTLENVTNSDPGTIVSGGLASYATIGDILLAEKQITISVNGTTEKAPIDFTIDLSLQIAVFVDEN